MVEVLSGFLGKCEDLLLSVVSYLKTAGGVSAQFWKQYERAKKNFMDCDS